VTRILGLSAFYHDSAAAIIEDGRIIAAAQEERFSRVKHDAGFPSAAVSYCLDEAGCDLDEVDVVAFYEVPHLKFRRLLQTFMAYAPQGYTAFSEAIPLWLGGKINQKAIIRRELVKLDRGDAPTSSPLFFEHHQSHAASAFYPSPFDEAIVLTMDGVGEHTTTSIAIGRGSELEIDREIHFPHSLGLLYAAFTSYLGFKVNSGEYKVMGLAPYGEPKFANAIFEHVIDVKPDGSFWLNMAYFDYCVGRRMTSEKMHNLLGGPPRQPERPLTQHHMDIAASIQVVTEEIVIRLTRAARTEYSISNLCLAGGVALNCVSNGKVLRDGRFDNIWIQPAAGDAGGALGAAYCAHYQHLKAERHVSGSRDAMQGAYLGPSYSDTEIADRLTACGAQFEVLETVEATIYQAVDALLKGNAVGWFQGRMEYGPRALGNRSILGDPRSATMQKTLNLRIKYRESFRPFAPSVRREDVAQWFELDQDSPYMLLVADVARDKHIAMTAPEEDLFGIDKLNIPRSSVPAVTHVDYSARVQTVHEDTNPLYHRLLTEFGKRTGCPVLVNTSFNVRGEPIVCTPEDAFHCFMGTDMETLVIGNCVLQKSDQNPELSTNYADQFELD